MLRIRRAPHLLAVLVLGLAVLLVGCGRNTLPGGTLPMTAGPVPPIDLAAPERYETATFALG